MSNHRKKTSTGTNQQIIIAQSRHTSGWIHGLTMDASDEEVIAFLDDWRAEEIQHVERMELN